MTWDRAGAVVLTIRKQFLTEGRKGNEGGREPLGGRGFEQGASAKPCIGVPTREINGLQKVKPARPTGWRSEAGNDQCPNPNDQLMDQGPMAHGEERASAHRHPLARARTGPPGCEGPIEGEKAKAMGAEGCSAAEFWSLGGVGIEGPTFSMLLFELCSRDRERFFAVMLTVWVQSVGGCVKSDLKERKLRLTGEKESWRNMGNGVGLEGRIRTIFRWERGGTEVHGRYWKPPGSGQLERLGREM